MVEPHVANVIVAGSSPVSRSNMLYTVYILQSEIDNSFYIGYTSNLYNRIAQHNSGMSHYTKRKLPWKLVYSEEYTTKTEAIKRELEIKKRKSKRYIYKLINLK